MIPFVEELRRRLPVRESEGMGHEGSDGEGKAVSDGKCMTWRTCRGDRDDNVPGADGIFL